jgi:hypothetical protein
MSFDALIGRYDRALARLDYVTAEACLQALVQLAKLRTASSIPARLIALGVIGGR